MAIRVNPKIIDDLEGYGAEDVQLCYHCGNCSAVCPHADEFNVFPRRPMRNLQLGLERKLETIAGTLALLLLRPMFRSMPARGRTRRDNDESSPLVDFAL